MRARIVQFVALGVTASLLSAVGLASSLLWQGEKGGKKPIDVSKLPAAVQATAKKVFSKLDGLKASQETEEGTLIFEVEGKGADGMDVSFTCPDNGLIEELEHGVAMSALPGDANKNIAKLFPGATVLSATAVEEHYFEVKLQKDGKTQHAIVGMSGRVSQDEEEGEEGEEGEDGK